MLTNIMPEFQMPRSAPSHPPQKEKNYNKQKVESIKIYYILKVYCFIVS